MWELATAVVFSYCTYASKMNNSKAALCQQLSSIYKTLFSELAPHYLIHATWSIHVIYIKILKFFRVSIQQTDFSSVMKKSVVSLTSRSDGIRIDNCVFKAHTEVHTIFNTISPEIIFHNSSSFVYRHNWKKQLTVK